MFNSPYLLDLTDDLPVMLIWVNHDFQVTRLNKVAKHLLARKDEAQGLTLLQLLPDLAENQPALRAAAKQAEKLALPQLMLHYNERMHPCYVTLYPLPDEQMALIKIEDLSHQTLLDDMVIQSEKMITIGGLAAGMAHEIKNPLGIILQNIQNILCRLDKTAEKNQVVANELQVSLDDINRYLEERSILKFMNSIRIAIDRALQIIATMLNFGTQNPILMKNEDLVVLLENALSFAEQDYDLLHSNDISKVKIVRKFVENLPSVVCSGTQITQVFFNLIKNAMQALHDHPNPEVMITTSYDDEYITIQISDNGSGIPQHLLMNLFKPFFTTKTSTQGTGLGLAVSHYIINENHRGTLSASNLTQGGACFTVKIPRKA